MEALRLFLTQFTDETITITVLVLVFFCAILIGYWIYNRRKFQELSHQIPATVVKNYLDTIIQNSTALKSSLFRGGGLEIGEGVPSVVAVRDMPQGNVSVSSVSSEEINQKNAEIALLKKKIVEKDKTIEELERMLEQARASGGDDSGAGEQIAKLQGEVKDLKGQLKSALKDLEAAQAAAGGGGDEALQAKLDEVSKERDEYKDRLTEYEIIEDELANLKRLQQENEQLKKTIAELQGGAAPVAAAAPKAKPQAEPVVPKEEPVAEVPAAEESGEDLMAQMAAAMGGDAPEEKAAAPAEDELEVPSNQGQQKSAEELLSEFEKMLG